MMLRMTPQFPVPTAATILPPSPLVVGQAITGAFAIMRQRFGLFVALAFVPGLIAVAIVLGVLVVSAAAIIGAFAGTRSGAEPGNVVGAIALLVVLMLVGTLIAAAVQIKANGMIVLLAHETALGRRPDYQALNQGTRGIVGRTFVLILAAALAYLVLSGVVFGVLAAFLAPFTTTTGSSTSGGSAVGILVLVLLMLAMAVAMVFLGTRWLYLTQGLAIEGRGGFASLGNSWRLTKNDFWRTLGWYLLASVVVGAVVGVFETVSMGLLTPFMNALTEGNNPLAGVGGVLMFVYGLFLAVLQGLVVPFQLAYTTVMYIDQRRRNELAAAGVPLRWQPQQYPTQPGYGTPTPGYAAPTQPTAVQPGASAYGWQPQAGTPQPAPYAPPTQPAPYAPPTQPGATASGWQPPTQPPTGGVPQP